MVCFGWQYEKSGYKWVRTLCISSQTTIRYKGNWSFKKSRPIIKYFQIAFNYSIIFNKSMWNSWCSIFAYHDRFFALNFSDKFWHIHQLNSRIHLSVKILICNLYACVFSPINIWTFLGKNHFHYIFGDRFKKLFSQKSTIYAIATVIFHFFDVYLGLVV